MLFKVICIVSLPRNVTKNPENTPDQYLTTLAKSLDFDSELKVGLI